VINITFASLNLHYVAISVILQPSAQTQHVVRLELSLLDVPCILLYLQFTLRFIPCIIYNYSVDLCACNSA